MKTFQVLLERSEGWWVATVSGVPGCVSQGRTKAEAKTNIREALALHFEDRAEAVTPAPEPAVLVNVRIAV